VVNSSYLSQLKGKQQSGSFAMGCTNSGVTPLDLLLFRAWTYLYEKKSASAMHRFDFLYFTACGLRE
jgi:hypothetical protein